MRAQKSEERSQARRSRTGGKDPSANLRSGSREEKVERSPKDVTGINPRDMAPIDPRMPYIPPP